MQIILCSRIYYTTCKQGPTMNTHETMLEQIRRLNEEQARIHEQKRVEAINKIRLMRLAQREQQERNREYQ